MKNIKICDRTLCTAWAHFRFQEKIEIARQLERLSVNAVELPEIENAKTDTLLVRTVASFVKNSVLSVCGGKTRESIDLAARRATHRRKAAYSHRAAAFYRGNGIYLP